MTLRSILRPTIVAAALRCSWAIVVCFGTLAIPSPVTANQFVRLDYNLTLNSRSRDTVFIELFDDKPITRDNFMAYVNGGHYDGTFMHRLSHGFVMQGGGFYPEWQAEPSLPDPKWSLKSSPGVRVDLDGNPATPNPTIVNEYSVGTTRSNVRGTIAMARLSGAPNSATNQWFVNYSNSNAFLDTVDGGFTVFAQVRGDGMAYFDALATLQTSLTPGVVIANLNEDANNDGVRDQGPFGSSSTDGVPLLFGFLNNLVILEKAERVDYLGGTGSNTTLNVPGTGHTIWQRDMFIDTGATLTGTGRLIVYLDRTLGIREGMSLARPVANHGTLAPGLRNGAITVPHYQQYATGTLAIDIRGTTVDTHYDRVNVTTTAILDGTLEVSLLNDFVPAPGNSFTVLTAAAITGNFTNYDLPELPTSMFWTVEKTATSISISARGGDFDNNGVVNAADYLAWRNSFGGNVTAFTAGDGNGDGKVDAADYTIWRNNLGRVAFSNGGIGGLATVTAPEPTGGVLAILASAGLALRRTRKRHRR